MVGRCMEPRLVVELVAMLVGGLVASSVVDKCMGGRSLVALSLVAE